jgi:hypothetical protein
MKARHDKMLVVRTVMLSIVMSVIAAVPFGLSACGGDSSDAVVQIAGVGTISRTMLEHWIPIEAKLLHEELPRRPSPNGVVPDPPTYTQCIAYLEVTGHTNTKPSISDLKNKCAQKYREVKELTLNTLIGWEWSIGRGRALGMKVSVKEVKERLNSVVKNNLSGVSFQQYMSYTGQTLSDMLFRSRVQLFEIKVVQLGKALLARRARGQNTQQQGILARLPTTAQMVARTSCRRGYVTSSCKQYKGSYAPGFPN